MTVLSCLTGQVLKGGFDRVRGYQPAADARFARSDHADAPFHTLTHPMQGVPEQPKGA